MAVADVADIEITSHQSYVWRRDLPSVIALGFGLDFIRGLNVADDPLYPADNVPVIFADTATNAAHSQEIVKFILARFELSMNTLSDSKLRAAAQIVMPISSFVNLTLFFNDKLDELVRMGVTSKDKIEEARRNLSISK